MVKIDALGVNINEGAKVPGRGLFFGFGCFFLVFLIYKYKRGRKDAWQGPCFFGGGFGCFFELF